MATRSPFLGFPSGGVMGNNPFYTRQLLAGAPMLQEPQRFPPPNPLAGAPLLPEHAPPPPPKDLLAGAPRLGEQPGFPGPDPLAGAPRLGAPGQVPPRSNAELLSGAPKLGERIGNFLGSDAALAMAAGLLSGGPTGQAVGRGFENVLGLRAAERKAAPTSDDLKEYAFAKQQGYGGSFIDYMTQMKKAGASSTNVDLKNMGTIPPGYQVDYDEAGNPVRMTPIPGSPAAMEAEAAAAADAVKGESQAGKAGGMLSSVAGIKREIANASTPVVGTLSQPFALYSGSAAGKVRSYVRHLQSGVALDAIVRLKEASKTGATGFGAMNEKELDLLINDIGALDPDTTDPKIFAETIGRIETRFKRIAQQVSPERQRELGLDVILGAVSNAASLPGNLESIEGDQVPIGTVEDGYRFRGGDPADQRNWEPVR